MSELNSIGKYFHKLGGNSFSETIYIFSEIMPLNLKYWFLSKLLLRTVAVWRGSQFHIPFSRTALLRLFWLALGIICESVLSWVSDLD